MMLGPESVRAGAKPGPPSMQTGKDDLQNNSGLNTQIAIDLLRILACCLALKVQRKELELCNVHKQYMKKVVTSNGQSSRLTIMMRQPGPWKCLACI